MQVSSDAIVRSDVQTAGVQQGCQVLEKPAFRIRAVNSAHDELWKEASFNTPLTCQEPLTCGVLRLPRLV